jgi:hypothetical protein
VKGSNYSVSRATAIIHPKRNSRLHTDVSHTITINKRRYFAGLVYYFGQYSSSSPSSHVLIRLCVRPRSRTPSDKFSFRISTLTCHYSLKESTRVRTLRVGSVAERCASRGRRNGCRSVVRRSGLDPSFRSQLLQLKTQVFQCNLGWRPGPADLRYSLAQMKRPTGCFFQISEQDEIPVVLPSIRPRVFPGDTDEGAVSPN